jgi:hypothetical protein
MADLNADVRAFLAERWSDRIVIDEFEPDAPIHVTVRGLPFVVLGAGCMYVAEYLTLERSSNGLAEIASSGSVPYVAYPPTNGSCPAPTEGGYAELGVSIGDLSRIRDALSWLNRGAEDDRKFQLNSVSWGEGTQFKLVSAFYGSNPDDPEHPFISASLLSSPVGSWTMDLETGCVDRCLIEIWRAEIVVD